MYATTIDTDNDSSIHSVISFNSRTGNRVTEVNRLTGSTESGSKRDPDEDSIVDSDSDLDCPSDSFVKVSQPLQGREPASQHGAISEDEGSDDEDDTDTNTEPDEDSKRGLGPGYEHTDTIIIDHNSPHLANTSSFALLLDLGLEKGDVKGASDESTLSRYAIITSRSISPSTSDDSRNMIGEDRYAFSLEAHPSCMLIISKSAALIAFTRLAVVHGQ
ncbi:hypothetical protein EV361DRAFT_954871 [Lentinula raphanica]|nr:hypothetical protein EV361DRAFT_954871 [Lentinula raphanica]